MAFRKTAGVLAFAGFLCLLLSISSRAQAPENCDDEASFGRSDKMLFGKYCGACHTLSGRWKRLVKTPLSGLFEREQLVTGERPTEEAVREIIENGRPIFMPGFKYTLRPNQINELIQFLKSARCDARGQSRLEKSRKDRTLDSREKLAVAELYTQVNETNPIARMSE